VRVRRKTKRRVGRRGKTNPEVQLSTPYNSLEPNF
jgi:hypothetical protein